MVSGLLSGALVAQPIAAEPNVPGCRPPALSQITRHRIASGETLETIARQYNLIPATLLGLNPVLRNGALPVGSEILVPPFNGIRVEVPPGQTVREVAATYNIRSDVLFEINGCQTAPAVVFVPGVNWSPNAPTPQEAASPNPAEVVTGYPLSTATSVLLSYGWRLQPGTPRTVFHSGVDLAATRGTPVLAVGDGTIAFAGEQGNYGKLVVINHPQGWQTRYAHLSAINVRAGQTVRRGTPIARTGTTGQPSSPEPHLHFELRSNSKLGWVAENPESLLRAILARARE